MRDTTRGSYSHMRIHMLPVGRPIPDGHSCICFIHAPSVSFASFAEGRGVRITTPNNYECQSIRINLVACYSNAERFARVRIACISSVKDSTYYVHIFGRFSPQALTSAATSQMFRSRQQDSPSAGSHSESSAHAAKINERS